MARLCIALALFIAVGAVLTPPAFCDGGKFKLASSTGRLLYGTLYKQSGITREGTITIRTASNLISSAPVYRYDFDILHGTIDGKLYSFLMADIAEMDLLPSDGGEQPVNILLRSGVLLNVILSTESRPVFGASNLTIKEADVVTDKYGEDIVSGGAIKKIVFKAPPAAPEDMPSLVDRLGKALYVGKRDGLVDDDFYRILSNIESKMKAALAASPER